MGLADLGLQITLTLGKELAHDPTLALGLLLGAAARERGELAGEVRRLQREAEERETRTSEDLWARSLAAMRVNEAQGKVRARVHAVYVCVYSVWRWLLPWSADNPSVSN